MKRPSKWSTIAGVVTSSHRDWKFIQSVGGIRLSATSESEHIPVYCDVSGLAPATPGPTSINSALAVKQERYKLRGKTIQYWIVTCVFTENYRTRTTKGIRIPGLADGEYSFEYLNPDGTTVEVGKIEVRH